jgi:signal transduction histidine kinase/CheY-like chemotaxis protein
VANNQDTPPDGQAPAEEMMLAVRPIDHPDKGLKEPSSVVSCLAKQERSRPEHLLVLAGRAVGAAWSGLALLSADGEFVNHFTYGLPEEAATALGTTPWCDGLMQLLSQHPIPVRVDNLAASKPALCAAAQQAVQGLPPPGPFLGVSLTAHGRSQGIMYFLRFPGAAPFEPADEELLLPVRGWLEQGTLSEETRLQAKLRLLNQVAQAAAGSQDLASLLQASLRALERHLPLHACVIWLVERKKHVRREQAPAQDPAAPSSPVSYVRLAASSSAPQDRAQQLGLVPGLRLRIEHTPFASGLLTGQALYTDLTGAAEQTTSLAKRLAARGACASFAVPLRTGKETVGILQSLCTQVSGFTNEQVQVLYLVADLLGPAISNCQLFRRLRTAYEELRCTQNQLVQAEKMRAVGELASGMAHDFNNSLCGVLGFLELALTDKSQGDQARSYLESARTCTLDAAETVRRVQNFARWQRNELTVQSLDINELVRETIQLTRHKWENLTHARGTSIAVEVQTDASGRVMGSAAELREVLTNLVFNAVDAMPQGGKLSVHTWSTATDVFLAVHDTGVGMNSAVRRRVFEPFFTTKGERGNGLGLSVTYGIIQRYGGEIEVDSKVGQGSTFRVRLPLVRDGQLGTPVNEPSKLRFVGEGTFASGSAASSTGDAGRPALAATPRSLRVLVIEDEESIRRVLEYGLAQLGHSARLAADGREGLSVFAEERFDVVLTDLGLPGMSGEEVARSVARQSPETPVILLTGWSGQLRDEGEPLEGVTCVLGKPVKLQTLAHTLMSVMADKAGLAANGSH